MLRASAVAAVLAAAGPAAGGDAAKGDVIKGERAFQYCFSCHSVDPTETDLQGPNLFGIVGRPAAALPGFAYSDALKARARTGLVWREGELDAYIADPPKFIPGNKMNYFGVKNATERADLIAYLRAAK